MSCCSPLGQGSGCLSCYLLQARGKCTLPTERTKSTIWRADLNKLNSVGFGLKMFQVNSQAILQVKQFTRDGNFNPLV